MQLVDGVFLGLCDCARAVIGRIDRVDIVVVGVNLRGLVNQVDSLVAVAAEGIGKVIEARVERILLVLDLGKRILRCGQALGRRLVAASAAACAASAASSSSSSAS